MDVTNSIENAQNTIMRPGYSFNLHASEIYVSETCGANFISSKWSFAINCMELMLTCEHSVGFVIKSVTSESINSGQRNISPLNTNAYS